MGSYIFHVYMYQPNVLEIRRVPLCIYIGIVNTFIDSTDIYSEPWPDKWPMNRFVSALNTDFSNLLIGKQFDREAKCCVDWQGLRQSLINRSFHYLILCVAEIQLHDGRFYYDNQWQYTQAMKMFWRPKTPLSSVESWLSHTSVTSLEVPMIPNWKYWSFIWVYVDWKDWRFL